MRVVFIGGVRFSAMMLEQLMSLPVEVVGVCTRSPRVNNSDEVDLRPIAERYKIPCKNVSNVNDSENLDWLESLKPDLVLCFGWSQLLGRQILELASMGVIGFHPAALPANRGRHPIIWALALGLNETASTFFFMDEGADSGEILSQESVAITESDDAATLYEKITAAAKLQIQQLVPQLINRTAETKAQDNSKANYWRKRTSRDGRIDWRMSNTAIHNLVRALTFPYPGAHFTYEDQEVKVWSTEIVDDDRKNLEPGLILENSFGVLTVKAGSGAIRLVDMDPTIPISVGDYL